MPIIKSAKKKLRQDKIRTKQNLLIKKAVKSAISVFKKKPTPKMLEKVYSLLDNAVKKNIFHKNKSARLKSNLSKLLGKKPLPQKTQEPKSPTRKAKSKKSSS